MFAKLRNIRGERMSLLPSFSQCGEDRIAAAFFRGKNKKSISYIDIGANDPYWLNNTYLFYRTAGKKRSGVLIEPDVEMYRRLRKNRPRDIVLNIGLGKQEGSMEFYVMNEKTLNTFSKSEADDRVTKGYRIEKIQKIKITTFNDVVRNYLDGKVDFVSLDVEGMEFEILETIDFRAIRPSLFCIEMNYHNIENDGYDKEIYDLLLQNGYYTYAFTRFNVFFADSNDHKSKTNKMTKTE